MTCSCPKCLAHIEVEHSKISESGAFTSCPECKSRFWVNKESYARMALIKEGKLYCDKCGKELDHRIVCSACGVMYPDYYLVQASKPPRRQIEKPDLFALSFTLKPATPTYAYTYTYKEARNSVEKSPSVLLKRAGLMILVALLAVGLGYFYHINKVENQYAKNYMRALYTIKTGTDLSQNTCTKISAEWRTKMVEGRNFAPHITVADESRLKKIKDATDILMQKLKEPPKKFIVSKQRLDNLYGIYTKSHTLALAPSGSLSAFTDSSSKTQTDFKASVQELKGSLPPKLSEELKIAKAKYKGLKDI